ncbi:TetR/AcrR family transcriptional regulator [Vibrio genomosp. F6]|uniref:TetR family transcriptional regulator n=1 Tax=Vibrio genomosp. F6 str. FF-238 TaxID=1191298 RepID=A0A1E5D3B8_9VIBR|nr:TetR/AcrR family transcriptional regulator [Vibrio genomosp. F6]OEE78049.1 TetR family transcriptional regulator [Vibrio genomosp. F6 str. FF-238]
MTERKQGRRCALAAEETKHQIITVAAQMFCELGYERVSLRNISEKAGVSHSLIRHHFGSKENIWYSISDSLHEYMLAYMKHILQEMPQGLAANTTLYLFITRMQAHMLIRKEPIQFIADAVRQAGELLDYFIDSVGEIEAVVYKLEADYNRDFPETPIRIDEIKWQSIMSAHAAASLTPFMKETWANETTCESQCLLNHWQIFNQSMVRKLHIAPQDELKPTSLNEIVYEVECKMNCNRKSDLSE